MIPEGKIYGLFDPATQELRYVGKTIGSPFKRLLLGHLKEARTSPKITHKLNWLRSLLKLELIPEVEVLEGNIYGEEQLNEAEIWHIAYWKSLGCRLTNGTPGGDGQSSQSAKDLWKRSDFRKKMTAAHRLSTNSDSLKKKWKQDSAFRAKMSVARSSFKKKAWAEPEGRTIQLDLITEGIKNWWANPVHRIERSTSYAERMKLRWGKPEERAKLSLAMRVPKKPKTHKFSRRAGLLADFLTRKNSRTITVTELCSLWGNKELKNAAIGLNELKRRGHLQNLTNLGAGQYFIGNILPKIQIPCMSDGAANA